MQGSHPPSIRRRRLALDVWFGGFPVWATLLFCAILYASVEPPHWIGISYETSGPGAVVACFVGIAAMFFTAVLCLVKVDKIDRGLQKAKWYVIVILLPPFGPSLCYFAHLRRHL